MLARLAGRAAEAYQSFAFCGIREALEPTHHFLLFGITACNSPLFHDDLDNMSMLCWGRCRNSGGRDLTDGELSRLIRLSWVIYYQSLFALQRGDIP